MKSRVISGLLLISAADAGVALAAERTVLWTDVPFIAQAKNGCGSAAISMVMQYWEKKDGQGGRPATGGRPSADAQKIQAALFSPAAGGIPASPMQKYFLESAYLVFPFQWTWPDLQPHLQQCRPT